jgi:NADPH-dependent ferric siderophore reductase
VARAGPVLGVLNDLTQTCELLSRGELQAQRAQQAALREQMLALAEAMSQAAARGDAASLPALAERLRQLAADTPGTGA